MANGDARSGEICLAPLTPLSCEEPADGFLCSLPATSPENASQFLEVVGSGGTLGTGAVLQRLGVNIPLIRTEYEQEIRRLVAEVERRRAEGQSPVQIARYAVEERRRIANRMRWRSGAGTRVLFEIRDWAEYGPGGRSHRNVERRYLRRGHRGTQLHEQMVRGATKPNQGISGTAVRGARYLRHGGRVIVVMSVATTAYVLLTTPEEELPRVLSQEAGGLLGGALGGSAGVGVCLVFGIATGGWGLLACGVAGGFAGGLAGTYAADRVYLSTVPEPEVSVNATGVLDAALFTDHPPTNMCVAPLTR